MVTNLRRWPAARYRAPSCWVARGVGAERLDAVRIEANLPGAQADRALALLGFWLGFGPVTGHHPDARRIYFCEDLRRHVTGAPLPLLSRGVILRLRRSGVRDEATVELRPARRTRLTDRWLAFHGDGQHRFQVEAAWSGHEKMLTASLTAQPDPGHLGEVLSGRRPVSGLFTDVQHEFLSDCADATVDLDALTVLGPVHAMSWPDVDWHGYQVAAERWTLSTCQGPPLDMLELSLRVGRQGAEIVHIAFDAHLRRHGLQPSETLRSNAHLALGKLAP